MSNKLSLIYFIIFIISISCASADRSYKEALLTNDESALLKVVNDYPESQAAYKAIIEIEFRALNNESTYDEYRTFMEHLNKSIKQLGIYLVNEYNQRLSEKVTSKVKAEYEKAKRTENLDVCLSFLYINEDYSDVLRLIKGPWFYEAVNEIDERYTLLKEKESTLTKYREARQENTVYSYEQFISNYGNYRPDLVIDAYKNIWILENNEKYTIHLAESSQISNPYGFIEDNVYYFQWASVIQWLERDKLLLAIGEYIEKTNNEIAYIEIADNEVEINKLNENLDGIFLQYKGTYDYINPVAGIKKVPKFIMIHVVQY